MSVVGSEMIRNYSSEMLLAKGSPAAAVRILLFRIFRRLLFFCSLAVRAAILLLPLLGATNFIQIIQTPNGLVAFAIVTITKGFFQSFQGFFISLLYCFLNKEVRNGEIRKLSKWKFRRYQFFFF